MSIEKIFRTQDSVFLLDVDNFFWIREGVGVSLPYLYLGSVNPSKNIYFSSCSGVKKIDYGLKGNGIAGLVPHFKVGFHPLGVLLQSFVNCNGVEDEFSFDFVPVCKYRVEGPIVEVFNELKVIAFGGDRREMYDFVKL